MTRAWARLKQHWVRHLLAALQVAVGVAAVMAVLIDAMPVLRSAAADRSEVFSAVFGQISRWGGSYSMVFQADDPERIRREADAVAAAAVVAHEGSVLIRVDEDLYAVRGMTKVSPGIENVADIRLVQGRFLVPEDAEPLEPSVAVISAELAEALFPGGDPVGRVINLRPDDEYRRVAGLPAIQAGAQPATGAHPGLDLQIVGVFEYPKGTSHFSGLFYDQPRSEILIPATGWVVRSLSSLPPLPGERGRGDGPAQAIPTPAMERYSHLYFRAVEGRGGEAIAALEAVLRPRIEERDRAGGHTLLIRPVSGGIELVARLQGAILVGAMGMAALVVSAFSIFTTFLAGVAERVKEIGMARALGATRLRIVREIAGEAAWLAAGGGALGIVLSFPARSLVFQRMTGLTEAAVTPFDAALAAAIGLLVSAGIGAAASLYPAWTVARLLPAEAFREQ